MDEEADEGAQADDFVRSRRSRLPGQSLLLHISCSCTCSLSSFGHVARVLSKFFTAREKAPTARPTGVKAAARAEIPVVALEQDSILDPPPPSCAASLLARLEFFVPFVKLGAGDRHRIFGWPTAPAAKASAAPIRINLTLSARVSQAQTCVTVSSPAEL